MQTKTDTIIIGASVAGLACARCLQEKGVETIVLEKSNEVAAPWRSHYDRLHLHTPKRGSELPYLKMPASYPKYPGRDQVVEYLENYAGKLHQPPSFGNKVISVTRHDEEWITTTENADYSSKNVVIATGYTRKPVLPSWKGRESFKGPVMHSSEYKNGQPFKGKKVLVVGFGNSACEIAICLHEHGALPSMSVRSPVNVIPRDILSIPVLTLGITQAFLPPGIADLLNQPLMKLIVGDITKYGLKKLPYGATSQIIKHKSIPLLDIGTMKLIKEDKIKIKPGISSFSPSGVYFDDGTNEEYEAIVLGTGYTPAVDEFLSVPDGILDESGCPYISGKPTSEKGLYFCGFKFVATGGFREVAKESIQIARYIANGLLPA